MFRDAAIGLFVLLLALPAAAKGGDRDYQGADGGYLVYSVGTIKIGMDFAFGWNRKLTPGETPEKPFKGVIEPRLGGAIYLKIKKPDFAGVESGHVVVRRLPPGNYEVNSFYFGGSNLAGTTYAWSSAVPFSFPFTITPGGATYIGSFMRAPSLGTPLEPALGAAGFFVIADRSDRDLPIATGRLPDGTHTTINVTDVSAFGSEMLRVSEP